MNRNSTGSRRQPPTQMVPIGIAIKKGFDLCRVRGDVVGVGAGNPVRISRFLWVAVDLVLCDGDALAIGLD